MSNDSGVRPIGRIIALCTLMMGAPAAMADWALNMPRGITDTSGAVYELHMLAIYVCLAIAVLVFGTMIVSLVLHRKSRGHEAATFSHSTRAEIIWTIVPVFILVALSIPAAKTLVVMEDTRDTELTIKVTGYQWKWHYEYLGTDIEFFSSLAEDSNDARMKGSGIDPYTVPNYLLNVDQRMVVPVDTKIRVLITANDVLHAWWVPDLAVKKDAIPGFINEVWFKANETGVFRGQCAELCGRDHGFMPIVVEILSKSDYADWAAGSQEQEEQEDAEVAQASITPLSLEDMMAKGEGLYNAHCGACHQANGQGLPPTFPSLVDGPVVKGPVADHISLVVEGVPGTAMVGFGSQLNALGLAAIITYERNAWGLNSGDIVQASDIAAAE